MRLLFTRKVVYLSRGEVSCSDQHRERRSTAEPHRAAAGQPQGEAPGGAASPPSALPEDSQRSGGGPCPPGGGPPGATPLPTPLTCPRAVPRLRLQQRSPVLGSARGGATPRPAAFPKPPPAFPARSHLRRQSRPGRRPLRGRSPGGRGPCPPPAPSANRRLSRAARASPNGRLTVAAPVRGSRAGGQAGPPPRGRPPTGAAGAEPGEGGGDDFRGAAVGAAPAEGAGDRPPGG